MALHEGTSCDPKSLVTAPQDLGKADRAWLNIKPRPKAVQDENGVNTIAVECTFGPAVQVFVMLSFSKL